MLTAPANGILDIAKKTENDTLTVYYNPDNPEELRPDMSHGIFGVIMFGLILIGIIVVITKGNFK